MFLRALVKVGFKEIEVAYPSASEQEYQFCRSIIENGEVPDDVALQVKKPELHKILEILIRTSDYYASTTRFDRALNQIVGWLQESYHPPLQCCIARLP